MPCESAAVGLVTVGAVARRLGEPSANDREAHAEWMLQRFKRRERVLYRHRNGRRDYRGVFELIEVTPSGMARFKRTDGGTIITCSLQGLDSWYEVGAPITSISADGKGLQNVGIYQGLIGSGVPIRPENLARTESSICLATHTRGEAHTQALLEGVGVTVGSERGTVAELTSAHSWCDAHVSRLVVWNTRINEIDRNPIGPRLLIAHGMETLLRVVDDSRFSCADVICVLETAVDRDAIERLNTWLRDRRQWCNAKSRDEVGESIGQVPAGVAVQWLEERP